MFTELRDVKGFMRRNHLHRQEAAIELDDTAAFKEKRPD